jgi:ribonuclease G
MPENKLVVNAEGPETRVGILEDGLLVEYFVERKRERGIVGNIYKGRIKRVLPGMQAAFVDLGPTVERNAYLYVADVLGAGDEKRLFEGYDGDDGDESPNKGKAKGGRMSKRAAANRKIEDLVREGQEILVQIVKEPVGLKGARVTGYLTLPGRHSVLMPTIDRIGVSRRIASEKERRRLRDLVDEVRPKGVGFIVRTAAESADGQEVQDDVEFLVRLWNELGKKEATMKKPGLLYSDLDMVLRCVRDLLRDDVKEIVIDSDEQYQRARKFSSAFMPRYTERIVHYEGRQPIFDAYGIEAALRQAMGRKVPLKSGGHLVIEQGEALTAIDVNTGSFVGKDDLESTITANNLEACREVAHQLRLRNIGGIIVIDFVDMDKEANRKQVWDAFNKALATDRTRANVTKISELGLVEMTRKRTRESLMQVLTEPCPACTGSGVVRSTTTLAYEIIREIRRLGSTVEAGNIRVECPPNVAELLERFERPYLDELEKRFQKKIEVEPADDIVPGHYRVAGYDSKAADDEAAAKKGKASKRRRSRGGRGTSRKKKAAEEAAEG